MQHSSFMSMMNRAGNLGNQRSSISWLDGALAQNSGKGLPFDKAHAEIRLFFVDTCFMNWNNIRVLKQGDGFCLCLKSCHLFGPCVTASKHHFQGNHAPQIFLPCFIYHPHSAPSQFFKKFELSKVFWQRCCWRGCFV